MASKEKNATSEAAAPQEPPKVDRILLYLRFFWEPPSVLSTPCTVYRFFHCLAFVLCSLIIFIQFDRTDENQPEHWTVDWRGDPWFPIHLTSWSITFDTIQAIMGLTVFVIYHVKRKGEARRCLKCFWNCYKTLQRAAVSNSLLVTSMYYCRINNDVNLTSLCGHAFNSILMFIDFIVTSHPFTLRSFFTTFMFGFTYVVFTLFYYLAGGVDRNGAPYMYPFLNWHHPWLACFALVVAELQAFVIHAAVWCLWCWKTWGLKESFKAAHRNLSVLCRRKRSQPASKT